MRAPLNRTMTLSNDESVRYKSSLAKLESPATREDIQNKLFCQDVFTTLPNLPDKSVDLIFADPPYNLTKSFNDRKFKKISTDAYAEWLESWLSLTIRLLKPTASVYICGDWRSATAIQRVGENISSLRTGSHGSAKKAVGRSQTGRTARKTYGFLRLVKIITSTWTR